MKRTAKLVLPAFVIVSLAGLIVLAVLYYRTRGARQVTFNESADVGIRVDDFDYANTRGGRTVWRMEAREATRFKTRRLMVMKGVHLFFYPESGGRLEMRAREGRFDEAGRVVTARGSVEVSSPDGYRLRTRRLRYETDRGLITSAEPVAIYSRDMEVRGVGFRVELREGTLYIVRGVRAVIRGGGVRG